MVTNIIGHIENQNYNNLGEFLENFVKADLERHSIQLISWEGKKEQTEKALFDCVCVKEDKEIEVTMCCIKDAINFSQPNYAYLITF